MIRIYTDAAFDLRTKTASYCHVIVDEKTNQKVWKLYDLPDADSSGAAEAFGLFHALKVAGKLRTGGFEVAIYCDSLSALSEFRADAKNAGVKLHHIKGHLLCRPASNQREVEVTPDRKRQHWADVMAYWRLRKRLDIISTSDNNEAVMETTK